MNRKATFADSFWGPDFQSTAGYDALRKRLKEGKQTCLSFEQFLRMRAKAEEDYSKSLQKCCKLAVETQESGTLRSAWDYLREKSEHIAQVHLEASGHLSDSAARLCEFTRYQKSERITKESSLCQNAKEKSSLYRKTNELKRVYEAKSSEFEQADLVMKKAKPNENSFSTKEWDKIIQKQVKSAQEANRADALYRESVIKLEHVRLQWERDMTQFCELCETSEDSRIKMMQNEMWMYCNILSSNCVEEDHFCESIRSVLEHVSVESDIQSFINRSGTGTERPAPVVFEHYQPTNQEDRFHNSPPGDAPIGNQRPHFQFPLCQAFLSNKNQYN